jgi:nucleoside phosphorylase
LRILIITPMKKEFHCAREVFAAAEASFEGNFRFATKQIRQNQIDILQCGFKPDLSLGKYHEIHGIPDILIDSGSCGGLKAGISPGEIFNIGKVMREGAVDLYYETADSAYKLPEASLIEVSKAVDNDNKRSKLAETADLCSMESYSLSKLTEKWACSRYSFRVVTDLADSKMKNDFKHNFKESCLSLYGFIYAFLNDLSH